MIFDYWVIRKYGALSRLARENILCETPEEAMRLAKERAVKFPRQCILIQVEARPGT